VKLVAKGDLFPSSSERSYGNLWKYPAKPKIDVRPSGVSPGSTPAAKCWPPA
jgi:hypothetical protein